MSAAVRIRAVIVEGELDDAAIAAIRQAIDEPEYSVVFSTPRVSELVERVSWETGVSQAVIYGPSTTPGAVRARFAVCWVAHKFCGRSLNQIGQALADRDHTAVRYAVHQAQVLRQRDPAFLALTDKVIAHFRMGGVNRVGEIDARLLPFASGETSARAFTLADDVAETLEQGETADWTAAAALRRRHGKGEP